MKQRWLSRPSGLVVPDNNIVYPTAGTWVTEWFVDTTSGASGTGSGARAPAMLWVPAGASPAERLPLMIHVNGASDRDPGGSDVTRSQHVLGSGLGALVNASPSLLPRAFYLFPLEASNATTNAAGTALNLNDPANEHWVSHACYLQAIQWAQANYNILPGLHLSGYSAGTASFANGMVLILKRLGYRIATITLWDGIPSVFLLTCGPPPSYPSGTNFSDLLDPATYPLANSTDVTSLPQVRDAYASISGLPTLPWAYHHGAGTYGGSVQNNDPTLVDTNGGESWLTSFAREGVPTPTVVNMHLDPTTPWVGATTNFCAMYDWDHADLNSNAFVADNSWFGWWPRFT